MQVRYFLLNKHIKIFLSKYVSIKNQGCSQNLKEVPQNCVELFNVDDVTANDIIETIITKKKTFIVKKVP